MSKLRKRAEELLVRWVEADILDRDAEAGPKPGRRPAASLATALAYVAAGASEVTTHLGSEKLLASAWQYLKGGVIAPEDNQPGSVESSHFTVRPLFDAYELLRPHATKDDREKLDQRFAGLMQRFAESLKPRFRAHGMNDLDLGTGLNHTVCWAALLMQSSQMFGRSDWRKLALDWAHRVAESQDESGYVSEHVGPSVLYDTLTLEALGRIYYRSSDKTVGKTTEKLARFLVHCLYPDLRTVATFDERGRGTEFLGRPAIGLQAVAEGLRVFERMVDHGWERVEKGESVRSLAGSLASTLIFLQDGRARLLPSERKSALFQVGKQAVIRRRTPWFTVLSAFGNPPPSHNIFFHERTSILSVWHDAVGRIIGGGNDRDPEFAAFVCKESDWIYYCLPRGGSARATRSEDTLDLDYGAADVHLGVKTVGADTLILRVSTDLRERRNQCFLNLQLPFDRGGAVTLGGSRKVTLKPTLKLREHKAKGRLEADGWRIEAPEDSLFVWPHHPYVPYPGRGPSKEAVGFLRVPLAPVRGSAEVRIIVKV